MPSDACERSASASTSLLILHRPQPTQPTQRAQLSKDEITFRTHAINLVHQGAPAKQAHYITISIHDNVRLWASKACLLYRNDNRRL